MARAGGVAMTATEPFEKALEKFSLVALDAKVSGWDKITAHRHLIAETRALVQKFNERIGELEKDLALLSDRARPLLVARVGDEQ